MAKSQTFTGSGRRSEYIELLKPADPLARNANGEVIEAYDLVIPAWAAMTWDISQVESVVSNQSQGKQQATFRFLWCQDSAGLDTTWRIKQKRTGKTFGILSAFDLDERGREWVVVAIRQG